MVKGIERFREHFAGQRDVLVLDTLSVLQSAERNGDTIYFANDGHLNTLGQKHVAKLLLNNLSK